MQYANIFITKKNLMESVTLNVKACTKIFKLNPKNWFACINCNDLIILNAWGIDLSKIQ